MTKTSPGARLQQLESARNWRGPGSGSGVEKLLELLRAESFRDSSSLIRFHDALLFLRAFPQNRTVAREAERLLANIGADVARLRESGADMEKFDSEAVSGI